MIYMYGVIITPSYIILIFFCNVYILYISRSACFSIYPSMKAATLPLPAQQRGHSAQARPVITYAQHTTSPWGPETRGFHYKTVVPNLSSRSVPLLLLFTN